MTWDQCLDRVRGHCRKRVHRTLFYNPPTLDHARALRWRVPGGFDVLPKEWTPAWDEPVRQLPGQLLDRWMEKRGYDLFVLYEGHASLLGLPVRGSRYDRSALVYLPVNLHLDWARDFNAVEYRIVDQWTTHDRLHFLLESRW